MKRHSGFSVAGPLVVAAVLSTFSLPAAAQTAPAPSVTTMDVVPADFTQTVRLPGRVKASTLAEVRPQVSGIISERLFEEGALVEKGAPLYKIEDQTYAAALAAARASVAQAEANLELAEREAGRAAELFARGTGSEQRQDSATATRDSARAALQMARAQLQNAEIDLDRTTVRAPISGVIGLSQSTVGALVSAQQIDALTTIRTLDPIYVDVTQSANELLDWDADPEHRRMRMPGHAKLLLPNGRLFDQTGELRAAEPRVEPTTGMVTLRIAFPNPASRLLPGLYVEVELPMAQTSDAVLLPKNVVMRDHTGATSVWLVENGKVVVRPVEIVTGSGNDWVTTGSLAAGDQVIISGFQKVAPGAQVEIAAPEPAPQGEAEPSQDAKGE